MKIMMTTNTKILLNSMSMNGKLKKGGLRMDKKLMMEVYVITKLGQFAEELTECKNSIDAYVGLASRISEEIVEKLNEQTLSFSNVSGQWVDMRIDNLPKFGDLIVLELPPEQIIGRQNPRLIKFSEQTEWIDGSRYILVKPIDA